MDHFFWTLLIGVGALLSTAAAGHALLYKRDPRSALGWISLCLTLPFLGPFFYWAMGVNRIHRKARQWLESGRRLAGWDRYPESYQIAGEDEYPNGTEYLKDLRVLSDRIVKSHLVGGNLLEPLHNGERAYPSMLEAIKKASVSVHLSTYIFDADQTGRKFVDELIIAAERGVDVRVIVDSLGEKYSRPLVRSLFRGTRVKLGRFLPLRMGGYVNLRNHRKLLITDGSCAFTGGMNIGGRHMVSDPAIRDPVVDVHFRVSGPVVTTLQRTFLEDWYFVTGELVNDCSYFPRLVPVGTAVVRGISDGPDKEFRKLLWIIMGALSIARRTVRIMTPYFIPDRPLISALVTASMRGVAVSLVLPEKNNLPFVHWASRSYLWELLQHGIRVYYQPPPFVHSKIIVVDDAWSLVGSANLDPRSLRLNFEFNLEVYDPLFATDLSRHIVGVIERSVEESLEAVDGRPVSEKVRDSIAKLFSPYL